MAASKKILDPRQEEESKARKTELRAMKNKIDVLAKEVIEKKRVSNLEKHVKTAQSYKTLPSAAEVKVTNRAKQFV